MRVQSLSIFESNATSLKPSSAQKLQLAATAEFLFSTPMGSVLAVGGIDGVSLRALLDQVDHGPDHQRVLLVRIESASAAEEIVERVIDLLADTALRLWPLWFTDISFAECRSDTLGRAAARIIARQAAETVDGLSHPWAEAAVALALNGRKPRVTGVAPAVELAQLTRALSRAGLVLILEPAELYHAPALVHALEWIAQNAPVAMVAIFPQLPANEPPWDRLLYFARQIVLEPGDLEPDPRAPDTVHPTAWLAPWRGLPHPLSDIEQRLAKMLAGDAELAPLFSFNRVIETVRGSKPRVDLVWMEGRLVVELDGYPDHGSLRAFMMDRHRDYELTLSGYTVLRIANHEIAQDIAKAIEKIRDLVRLRRSQAMEG
jgi:very-short-patch-repair endonuclease